MDRMKSALAPPLAFLLHKGSKRTVTEIGVVAKIVQAAYELPLLGGCARQVRGADCRAHPGRARGHRAQSAFAGRVLM